MADRDIASRPEGVNSTRAAAPASTISVVLADDHVVVRCGLAMLLNGEPDIDVVAEAGTADDARHCVRGHRPDVLVLDLNMPGSSSLDAIPALREESPETAIVVLTMQHEPVFARVALGAGALGYVLKDSGTDELIRAVRCAAAGESYLTSRLGASLAVEQPRRAPGELSQRELQVLRLIARGYTNGEIADRLYLSVRTVETHRAHIHDKLALSTRAQLVAFAIERGMLVGAQPPA